MNKNDTSREKCSKKALLLEGYILQEYAKERTGLSIAREIHIDSAQITNILKKNNIKVKNAGYFSSESNRVYTLNQECFDTLSPECLYWCGFLVSDGYVSSDKDTRYRVKIELKSTDNEHLEKFTKFVGSNKKIDLYHRTVSIMSKANSEHDVARIELSSRHMVETLWNYGIKSPKNNASIDKRLTNSVDYWRGIIDGDGCWTINKTREGVYHRLTLCSCNMNTLTDFQSFVNENICENKTKITECYDKGMYRICINCKNALKLANILYYDGCICLDRKLDYVRKNYAE